MHVLNAALSLLMMSQVGGATKPIAPVLSSSGCAVVETDANDGVLVAPENHHVLLETADVRVIEVTEAPHTKETFHTHARPSVLYFDRPAAMRYVIQGDEGHAATLPQNPAFEPFAVAVPPEKMHSVENTGDTPFHALRVELKHPGCDLAAGITAVMPGADDALVAAPATYKLLLENADVRVIDVQIPPHSKEPMHTHPWGGFVYVVHAEPMRNSTAGGTDAKIKEISAGTLVIPAVAQGPHSTENLGDGTLHAVRFELKHATPK